MRYKDTDYLHAAARVAYLENQLITKNDLLKAIDAESAKDAYRLLSGKHIFRDHSMDEYEQAFEENLAETYDLVEEITGSIGITNMFRYPVDGHNMKVMIKSRAAGGDFSGLYKYGGTVEPDVMQREFNEKDFYHVPDILGEAALEAADELAKTRDSQIVDILVDKAVIALMGKKAAEIDCECLTDYVTAKIDLTNIRSALRLLKMKKDTYTASKVFAEGGSFSIRELEEAYSMGYDGLKKLVERIPQSERMTEAVNLVKQGQSIGVFEQQADGCFRDLFEKARIVPFGIEPVITYLYLKDQEIRACRLVLVSKLYDLPKEKIAERVRYIYAD
ncbi:MAG: V-type ATPase subunit [Clostridiales bacterium]|nr:V-type ATPase subunit [Clostridiales bacterium]